MHGWNFTWENSSVVLEAAQAGPEVTQAGPDVTGADGRRAQLFQLPALLLCSFTSPFCPDSRSFGLWLWGVGWDRVLSLAEPQSQELGPRAPREELEPGSGKQPRAGNFPLPDYQSYPPFLKMRKQAQRNHTHTRPLSTPTTHTQPLSTPTIHGLNTGAGGI